MEIDRAAQLPTPQSQSVTGALDVTELWKVVQEQQARIERLEASMLPLPDATQRFRAGRPRLGTRLQRTREFHPHQTLSPVEAFQVLAPVTSQYATVPIWDGFNWGDCARRVGPGEWYMVVFRSLRREAVDDLTLEMHDYGAYIEAQRRASGLVFYFRGTPNEHRECLSFCIWTNREEAARAAHLPLHRIAMAMVDEKYEWYTLERYSLRKQRDRIRIDAVPVDASGTPLIPN